ncbi:MAG: tripartite tricarboxylate transporter TctB family protein [Desulfobacterales bacterium]|nr:tripartite tricarboxylate transporter TctB family protein [Desulfobacterales bacterium]
MTESGSKKQSQQVNSDLIVGGFSLFLGGVVFFSTRGLSRLGSVFVDYVVGALVVLAALVIIKGFVKPSYIRFFDSTAERNNVVAGVGILLLYLIALPIFGFLPSSYFFYFCFNLYLAEDRFTPKNLTVSLVLTLVVVTAFYIIFSGFLEVPLPQSMWQE